MMFVYMGLPVFLMKIRRMDGSPGKAHVAHLGKHNILVILDTP